MLQFEKLNKDNILRLKPFFSMLDYPIADNTLGCMFMWGDSLSAEFCIYKDCMILKEKFGDKDTVFRYPVNLSGDEQAEKEALLQIERFALEKGICLNFSRLDMKKLHELVLRYKDRICIKNARPWRDYLYSAEDLKYFKGGKYSGQRNHINKFKKLYPHSEFKVYTTADAPRLYDFLDRFKEHFTKNNKSAVYELKKTREIIEYIEKLDLFCGYLEVAGEIAAFSVAERFGDTLIIHCEKALTEYEGIYPVIVSEFAKAFCTDGILYINREDDAGDLGLRRSKMQYKPIKLLDKLFISIRRSIDDLDKIPVVLTERLTLKEIEYEDKDDYNRLALDEKLNKYWGYDYKDDLKEPFYDNYFVDVAKEDFAARSAINFGVYLGKKLIGEVVLQYFDYFSGAEIGARILPEYAHKGYGREAIAAAGNWAIDVLFIEKLYAKCYLENESSKNMLIKSGMRETHSDETFYYFLKEN